jgi:hypothetical protein
MPAPEAADEDGEDAEVPDSLAENANCTRDSSDDGRIDDLTVETPISPLLLAGAVLVVALPLAARCERDDGFGVTNVGGGAEEFVEAGVDVAADGDAEGMDVADTVDDDDDDNVNVDDDDDDDDDEDEDEDDGGGETDGRAMDTRRILDGGAEDEADDAPPVDEDDDESALELRRTCSVFTMTLPLAVPFALALTMGLATAGMLAPPVPLVLSAVELDAVAVPAALSALLLLEEIPVAAAVLPMAAEGSLTVGEGETRVGAITRFKAADFGAASAAAAAAVVAAAAVDCGAPRVDDDNDDMGRDTGAGVDEDIDDTVETAGVAIVLAEVARDRNGKTETDCCRAD